VAALSPDLLLLKASSLASWECLHQCVFALMNTDVSDSGDLGIHDPSIESADLAPPSSSGMMPAMMNQTACLTVTGATANRETDSAHHSRSSSVAAQLDQADQRSTSPSVPTSSTCPPDGQFHFFEFFLIN
jgi:hypothetical protein